MSIVTQTLDGRTDVQRTCRRLASLLAVMNHMVVVQSNRTVHSLAAPCTDVFGAPFTLVSTATLESHTALFLRLSDGDTDGDSWTR